MIIGGASVYHEFLPQADEVYISYLDLDVTKPDSLFPQSNLKNWTHKKDEDFVYTPQSSSPQDVAFAVKRYLSPRIASAPHTYPQHMHNRLVEFSLDVPQKTKYISPGQDIVQPPHGQTIDRPEHRRIDEDRIDQSQDGIGTKIKIA
jgi:hypothetical protein